MATRGETDIGPQIDFRSGKLRIRYERIQLCFLLAVLLLIDVSKPSHLTSPHLPAIAATTRQPLRDATRKSIFSNTTDPTARRLLRAFDCVHSAAVDRSMLSSSRFAVLASGFFHSLRSAFQAPPTEPLSSGTTSTSPSSAIDSDTFLPLLTAFQPSYVADVLTLAAHHARLQSWDTVHTIYHQLTSALLLRRDDKQSSVSAANSVPPSPSIEYAPLVSSLSSDEVDSWLAAVQQCRRDATMLQRHRHNPRYADDDDNDHIINEQAEKKRVESPPVTTTSVVGVGAGMEQQQHGKLSDEQHQQPADEILVCETEQQDIIVAGQTQHETADGAAGVVAAPRKRKRARRKRTKGEWGEMKVPARKRSKRQALKGSRAMDEQHAAAEAALAVEHSTETPDSGEHSASRPAEGEENGVWTEATVECDSAQDELNEAATHTIVTDSRESVDGIAANERYGDRPAETVQEDNLLMEGGMLETVGSTAATDTLHSRWKRPCKRLVRFRVAAGESEQRQIEALQEEYMKQNGLIPPASPPHSSIEQQQQLTLVTTDPTPDESAKQSHSGIRTDEQPATDQPSIQSDATQNPDSQGQVPLDPICPPPSADTYAVPSTSLSRALQPTHFTLPHQALPGCGSLLPQHRPVAGVADEAAVSHSPVAPQCLSSTGHGLLI